MDQMTPEKLRLLGPKVCYETRSVPTGTRLANDIYAAVSIWEADRKRLEQWEAEAQDKERPEVRPMTVLENAYMDVEGKLGSAGARIEALEKLLAEDRGCGECWHGVSCGADCHMNDVAALAAEED